MLESFEQEIWICALRYALGRKTYITGIVADFIIAKVDTLTEKTKAVMIRDIEGTDGLGHDCDKEDWNKLLNKLTK